MISQRAFMFFSYFVLIAMAVSLILLATGAIRQQMAWTVFIIILILYLLRIALRLILARQQREAAKAAQEASPAGRTPSSSGDMTPPPAGS